MWRSIGGSANASLGLFSLLASAAGCSTIGCSIIGFFLFGSLSSRFDLSSTAFSFFVFVPSESEGTADASDARAPSASTAAMRFVDSVVLDCGRSDSGTNEGILCANDQSHFMGFWCEQTIDPLVNPKM